jgi:hypothetical protein
MSIATCSPQSTVNRKIDPANDDLAGNLSPETPFNLIFEARP